MANLLDINYRRKILNEIHSDTNLERKTKSLKQSNLYKDKLYQYVKEDLLGQFSPTTVKEMPIISSVNTFKRLTDSRASIYKTAPKRTFENANDKEVLILDSVYEDAKANIKYKSSNKQFVYQGGQSLMQVLPKNGKLMFRPYKGHQIDVVNDPSDPENAMIYIINVIDEAEYEENEKLQTATGYIPDSVHDRNIDNETDKMNIANEDDYKKKKDRFVWWSKDYNFMTNGMGEVLDDVTGQVIDSYTELDIRSPLYDFQIMPFVDIYNEKDMAFFVESGDVDSDFVIQLNSRLSDLFQIVKMNGWSQAWMKGPKGSLPENVQIGPSFILRLFTDNNPVGNNDVDFGFASPNSDIQGSINSIEALISLYLSSKGIDPKTVTSTGVANRFSSGFERFLAMLEKFDATKEDYEAYKCAEEDAFEIIRAWLSVLNGTDTLNKKYHVSLPEKVYLSVKFHEPENIRSEQEQLDYLESKRESGYSSRVSNYMKIEGVEREQAIKDLKQFDEDEGLFLIGDANNERTKVLQNGEQSKVQFEEIAGENSDRTTTKTI